MDNFSPAQYDRFEAYRRHALPKQAVRKVYTHPILLHMTPSDPPIFQVIQQSLGQQVSQPVAQIVAGFAKVFVGEIIEKGQYHTLAYFVLTDLISCSTRSPSPSR